MEHNAAGQSKTKGRRRSERAQRRHVRQTLKEIWKRIHASHSGARKKPFPEMQGLDSKNRRLHYRMHRDFEHYYRRVKYVRPIGFFLILAMWACIFFYAGFNTGLGVALLTFSALFTVSHLLQSVFLSGIKKRVLKPIERLKEGVEEIAKGNYGIEVPLEGAAEVKCLISDFNGMARRLRENERLKAEYEENRKQLVANISHDLKTPITAIHGYIEAVLENNALSPEKKAKYLAIIQNNIGYMNRLIDDLFLFSRLDMQKLPFDFAPTDFKPFIADLLGEFKLDLEEQGAAFLYADELPDDVLLKIDAKRFCQVVRNIVDNALKYGDTSRLVIRCRAYAQDGGVCVAFSNNGARIPQDRLEHIFDRFYRLDTARTKDLSSTGLGLSIARELVAAHGGSITAMNNEDAGTCFIISLPIQINHKDGMPDEKHTDH